MAEAAAIVVSGNPVDGFVFFGPFRDTADAEEWAVSNERYLPNYQEWWLAALEKAVYDNGGL